MVMSNRLATIDPTASRLSDSRYETTTGVLTYGDGTAKANAYFLNGLVVSQGQYLDTTGQPSSFDVLQSEVYNNFTYQITLEKEIAKYRSTLVDLLHPAGMKVLGRFAMKSDDTMNYHISDALDQGHTLGYYTGNPGSYAVMNTDFTTASTNVVKFYGLSGANLESFLFTNNTILLADTYGEQIHSGVISVVNGSSNTVVLTDNVWLAFANVATVTANSGSNTINITTITDSYNIINNGIYTDPTHPLKDIVHAGDIVLIANNTQKTVLSVDYINNKIILTSNLTSNANSFLSVNRTLSTTNVKIFGPTGTQYYPEITTEAGESLMTEFNSIRVTTNVNRKNITTTSNYTVKCQYIEYTILRCRYSY
jgi:hypothetical protein